MASESTQHKLDRVRRPRVQITYDVETGGAMQKNELPFVVGVLADLSGQPTSTTRARRSPSRSGSSSTSTATTSTTCSRAAKPAVNLRVTNKLTDEEGTQAGRRAELQAHDDFEPAHVVRQVEPLRRAAGACASA